MAEKLRQVTDRFSLLREGRSDGNRRRYILEAVSRVIDCARTKELIKLGEAFGYYGHGRRELAGKLRLNETEVVMRDGKPIVVDNVPSNRCIFLDMSDEGVVTHTEEILVTPPGDLVTSMVDSKAGGWSWATGGDELRGGAQVRSFYGFDFVKKPNFVSLDHPAMLLESASEQEAMLLEAIAGNGYDPDSARILLNRFQAEPVEDYQALQEEMMMLEGALHEALLSKQQLADTQELLEEAKLEQGRMLARQRDMILESVESLPLIVPKDIRRQLRNLEDPAQGIVMLLESMANVNLRTLPGMTQRTSEMVRSEQPAPRQGSMVEFGRRGHRFV